MADFYTNVIVKGKNILYRGVKDGKRVRHRIEYKPTIFVKSDAPTEYQTVFGEYAKPIQVGNIYETRDYIKHVSEMDNFPIYGMQQYEYAYISDKFKDEILWNMDDIVVAYLDIEVNSDNGFPEPEHAAEPITAITVMTNGVYHTFGIGEYQKHRNDVVYHKCSDEQDLIRVFMHHWQSIYPDLITGWNVRLFDMPYLFNRIKGVMGEDFAKKLSPWGIIEEKKILVMRQMRQVYVIYGVPVLDYQELFMKYAPNYSQESYTLNHIAWVELGEKKLDYSEYESLHGLYKQNHQKFIEYNIRDVELVYRIAKEGKKAAKLIDLALTLAYDAKVNFDDVFSQVRMWDIIIFNELRKSKRVISERRVAKKDDAYVGAYVKAPEPGKYSWVVSFDLNSLYPHLIMQYNMSMETLVLEKDYDEESRSFFDKNWISIETLLTKGYDTSFLKKKQMTLTPKAEYFTTKKQGLMPNIMEKMYDDRVRYKKMAKEAKAKLKEVQDDPAQTAILKAQIIRCSNLEKAKKVCLNSAYGALGSPYFRYYDIRIATAITTAGQLSIRWIQKRTNEFLNKLLKTTDKDYIIASDTDSLYINLGPLVQTLDPEGKLSKDKIVNFLDKVCQKEITPLINEAYAELAEYMNAYAQKMQMKREAIAESGIWTAKKRYILFVHDIEGERFKEPEIKITGIEAIKSSTPEMCRVAIRKAIRIIMTGTEDDIIKFIKEFRKEFQNAQIEDIAFSSSVDGIDEYTDERGQPKKGCPAQVRGAIIHNRTILEDGLEKKYPIIKNGEKLKQLNLKLPNPYKTHIFCFSNFAPRELELDKYIDYEAQFSRVFLSPLKVILDCVGWQHERRASLKRFFSE